MTGGTVDLDLTTVGPFQIEFNDSTNYGPAAEVFNRMYGKMWLEWKEMFDITGPSRALNSARVVDTL